jgi:uncharacterized protein
MEQAKTARSEIPADIQGKSEQLKKILKEMGRVLVAFSGGVDSTFLLRMANDVLGENVLAVIASSEIYPEREQQEATKLAEELGVRYKVIQTRELDNPDFRSNPPERCYFCKRELFSRLKTIADEEGIHYVSDGSNVEDAQDFRPGLKAAEELGVRSPIKEAQLRKDEIRLLSKMLNLPTWNKPSMACLSTRFPYHTPIERESLRQIDQAEEYLRSLGFSQVRVRHYGEMARIEVVPEEFAKAVNSTIRKKIVQNLKKIGYLYVTLDLGGYRTGSMNEPLFEKNKSPSV